MKLTRRATDQGILCRIAAIGSLAWDWVDNRQVIRRAAFLWILWLTGKVMNWTLEYAWYSNQDGAHIAAVIAAIWAPLAALQGAIFRFYDEARKAT